MQQFILLVVVAWIAVTAGPAEAGGVEAFVEAARHQIGRTIRYDPGYYPLGYPNGDISTDRGVCTDVVIRALRAAYRYDLQQHVHEDMQRHFSAYPPLWGLTQPDKNIDHRRVPNLQTFFERKGWALPLSPEVSRFRPGDMVTCRVPPHLPHIMIVSDRYGPDNVLLVIHNIGAGTREENRLFEFELTGHYRIAGLAALSRREE
jgi:uncharacterized protein YijF (DUF1287 family)